MFWESVEGVNPAGHCQEQEMLQRGKQAVAQPQTLKLQLALGDSICLLRAESTTPQRESLTGNRKPCSWKEQVRCLMAQKFSYGTQNCLRENTVVAIYKYAFGVGGFRGQKTAHPLKQTKTTNYPTPQKPNQQILILLKIETALSAEDICCKKYTAILPHATGGCTKELKYFQLNDFLVFEMPFFPTFLTLCDKNHIAHEEKTFLENRLNITKKLSQI